MKKIRKKLEEQKKELRKMLERFANEDKKPEGDWDTKFPKFDGGALEEAADEVEAFDSLRSVEYSLELKLKKTNEALKRIKNNTYGKCLSCGKKISKERLEIIPEAEYCKDCRKKSD